MYIIGFKKLQRVVGLSRTTLWRMVRSKTFPAPRNFGTRCVAWKTIEVDKWLKARTRSRLMAIVSKVI